MGVWCKFTSEIEFYRDSCVIWRETEPDIFTVLIFSVFYTDAAGEVCSSARETFCSSQFSVPMVVAEIHGPPMKVLSYFLNLSGKGILGVGLISASWLTFLSSPTTFTWELVSFCPHPFYSLLKMFVSGLMNF